MRWIALTSCLLAAGCAQMNARAQMEKAQAAFDQAQAQCVQATPPQVGNYAALASCLAPPQRALYTAKGMPVDLTEVLIANQAVTAGQADRGEITVEQAKLRMAQLNSYLNERALRRRN